MSKDTLIVGILAIIDLLGVVAGVLLEKDVSVLIPILTVLIGYLIGANKENLISLGRGLTKKNKDN